MTPERAEYILSNGLPFGELRMAFVPKSSVGPGVVHPDGITEEEDQYIKAIWRTMPGSSTYYSALCEIAGRP